MTDNIEDKLSKLRNEYKKNLPDKVNDIITLWKAIQNQPEQDTITLFHRKAHSLHGTAGTYGFEKLSEWAASLEMLASSFSEDPSKINANIEQVDTILTQIQNWSDVEDKSISVPPAEIKNDNLSNKCIIYLLDNDNIWINSTKAQMSKFGFDVTVFNDAHKLDDMLKQELPTILVMNINLADEFLQKTLKSINKNPTFPAVPVLFIATTGDFIQRLQAVRLGGVAYLIKPISIEYLIKKIDYVFKKTTDQPKVLIIDDEIEVANYIALGLEKVNIKTYVITHSNEIDRALHEFIPDLILLDIYMPDCNGLELAAIIRQQSAYNTIPIIYLSAEEDKAKQLIAMKTGADDFVTKATKSEQLINIILNRVERYKKLSAVMVSDSLTGLYNHSTILKQVEIELLESRRLQNPISIAIVSLDNLKKLNESYGYHIGDQVIVSLSLMLAKNLREGDIIGRYNGDFLVILPHTSSDIAQSLIDDLRKKFLSLNYSHNQQIFNATFSAGIASFPEYITASELVKAAEESVKLTKKMGRNHVEVANVKNTIGL